MVQELKQGVYWVGVTDWALREFHGHELSTRRGSSYNAYLILDEKIALVDTVWTPHAHKLLENIREVVDPAKIDIVVINHAEADHSGALPLVLGQAPNAQLIASKRGAESIEGIYHGGWPVTAVGTGDRVPLGGRELIFFEAPMLHWPDTMFSYLTGENILMPNDAFGQHYATAFRYNDEVDQDELYEEALKYFANIITPFSKTVTAKIKELLALGLPISMIAPSHGVIWRQDPLQIVQAYQRWAEQEPEPRAIVLYDTMWNATRRMAEAIAAGLADVGADHKVVDIAVSDRNDTLAEIFRARTIVIGSPTMNNGLLPSLAPVLTEMKGLKLKNKLGAAFGSYGWGGESVKLIEEHLRECGIPLIREGMRCKWQPGPAELEACRAFGREIGEATKVAACKPAEV